MTFAEDLAAAKQAPRRTSDVLVEVNGRKYKIRISALDGTEFAAETLKHPPRLDVGADMQYGYNLNTLTEAVLPRCAVLLDGSDELEISTEQWADLLAVADGGTAQSFVNAVYTLNEYASNKAVSAARKVLAGSLQN